MRNRHAAMTDPAVARTGDLPRARIHLAESALPMVPLARAVAFGKLVQHVASTQPVQALQMTAALPALVSDPTVVQEAAALSAAMTRQWMSLHAAWIDGLAEIGREMAEVREANTVSKFVDQEVNLVQQGFALVSSQTTATIRLLENFQVNVAWWARRHVERVSD